MSSTAWSIEQVLKEESHRSYRVCEQYKGEALDAFFDELRVQMDCSLFFASDRSVDKVHQYFKQLSRGGAVAYKLLRMRHRSVPFQTFAVLGNPELAETITAAKRCSLDPFTDSLIHGEGGFRTAAELKSETASATLQFLASHVQVDTVSTERLHASNLRRVKTKASVLAPSIEELAAWRALRGSALTSARQQLAARQRRQHTKRKVEDNNPCGDNGEHEQLVPPRRKRRRRMSAWNAFVSVEASSNIKRKEEHRWTVQELSVLRERFHALTDDERQHFNRLSQVMESRTDRRRAREHHKNLRQQAAVVSEALASTETGATHPEVATDDLVFQYKAKRRHVLMLQKEVQLGLHRHSSNELLALT